MQHPEFPIFAFLAATLVLIPLPWHWRAGNVAIVSMIVWLFAVDVIYAVNSIVWAGNVRNPAPVWCDISTKIVVGVSYALPLCTLCICKHLEAVSSNRNVSYDVSDRRRRMIFEGIMCFGIPILFMALHYIVQGHRFDIFENIGCQAAVFISIQAIFIIWFPQLLFSIITLIYAGLALHHFIRRRLTFAAHLQNSNSALTTNRYLRLIAMAITEMCWGTALTAFNLYNNAAPGLRPWTTWADVHSNFSRVDIYPVAFIPPQFLRIMMLFWWVMPVSSFIFFIFFGFGEEAMKEYRKVWTWLRFKVLRKKSVERKATGLVASLPSFIQRTNNSGSQTLHVELKTTKSTLDDKHALITPTSASHSFTLTPATASTGKTAEDDTYTIDTLSYYDRSTDAGLSPHGQDVFVSDIHAPSHAPTPLPTHEEPQLSVLRDGPPGYHRPFSPPSVYPVVAHSRSSDEGIVVTVHRQASADRMV